MLEDDDYLVRQLRTIVKMIVNRSEMAIKIKQEAIQRKKDGQTHAAIDLIDEAIETAVGITPIQFCSFSPALLVSLIEVATPVSVLCLITDLYLEKKSMHRLLEEFGKEQKAALVVLHLTKRLKQFRPGAADSVLVEKILARIKEAGDV